MANTSLISEGQTVQGSIFADEDLVVAGRVQGAVEGRQTVTVSSTGILEASIVARDVIIEGIVLGDVTGTEGVVVTNTAQVAGEVRARKLTLQAGGRISGVVVSGEEPAPTRNRHSVRSRVQTNSWSPRSTPTRDESVEISEEVVEATEPAPKKRTTTRSKSKKPAKRSSRSRKSPAEVVETS